MKKREKTILDEIDEQKICKDCGQPFSLDAGEVRYFERMEFQIPKRCKECRVKKKAYYATKGSAGIDC